MWEELAQLFTSMQWYVILMLCVGLVLLFIELFIPGFGVFGISGLVCIAGGIVTHAVITQSIVQVLGLILIFSLIIIILFLILIRSARYGLLGKTPFVENKTAVPVNYQNQSEFAFLVGKAGVAVTDMRPAGKILIDDKVYEGIEKNADMVEKGERIKVVEVEGIKIVVEKEI